MAIQMRRGAFKDFDSRKMLPGEIAVILEGDPDTEDGRSIYVCFAPGIVKRFSSYEDVVNEVAKECEPGKDGYTPVRGKDYWTEEDRASIVSDLEKSPTVTALLDDLSSLDSRVSESIVEIRTGRREHFELGGWTGQGLGNLPTKNDATTVRFRTDKAYLFFDGETISTLNSQISFMLILADNYGKYVSGVSWTKSYTFNADTLVYITFKHDTDNNSYTDKINKYGYYFHKFYKDSSKWKGKTWYAFGTSMTDTDTRGKYPQVVDEFSGLNRTNKAIGGGGICPSVSHGGNVKENIMTCPYDVDLVTIECGLNDWGNVTLGNIGDKSNDTFIGNFTQCIEHLTNNTRAVVVGIMMVSTTYEADGSRRSPLYLNRYGYTYRDYVSAMIEVCNMYGVHVIDVMAEAFTVGSKNKETILDTIHFTDLGGQICGRYIWDKLKNIAPSEWRA